MVETTTLDALDATPHAEVFTPDTPRAVRLSLPAGERVPAHRHPTSTVVLYLIEGAIDITIDGETYDLDAGDVARFDGDQDISPRARDDAEALVVFSPI